MARVGTRVAGARLRPLGTRVASWALARALPACGRGPRWREGYTLELATGGVELAVQSGGKVFVARAATWDDAYWELRRKVTAG